MPTLLVIDDNKSVRDILQAVFSRRGFTVRVAESGSAGLALCAREAVDGLFVDINMPGMDGVQVCHALRNQPGVLGRTPAMWLMTGAYTRETAKLAIEAGALDVLRKPFELDDLYRRLDQQFPGASELRPDRTVDLQIPGPAIEQNLRSV